MMENSVKFNLLAFTSVILLTPLSAKAALSATQIMEKSERARKLSELASSATLETGGGSRRPAKKEFKWWRKLQEDQVHFNTLIHFLSPAEIRGEEILVSEKSGGKNEVLLYLPAYKKSRRVEAQQQSSAFMASDFSYSDIATAQLKEYEYSLGKEEPCPSPADNPGGCYVVVSKPANPDVRERTSYSMMRNWIRKSDFMTAQVEYHSLEGDLIKRLSVAGTFQIDPKRQLYFSKSLRMANLKSGQFTVIRFSNPKANTGIQDDLFSKQNLGKKRH